MVFVNLTEVRALGQVPSNEAVYIFVRASLPRSIWPCKVALHAELCSDLLVFSILGTIVQGQRSSALGWKLPETLDDRPGGLRSALLIEFGEHEKPALSFDQGMECRLAFPGDKSIALPVAVLLTIFYGLRTGIDRNSIWNLGLFLFSADALGFAFLMSVT